MNDAISARRAGTFLCKSPRLAALAAVFLLLPAAALGTADQLWLSQGVTVHPSERLRIGFSNTLYFEHGEHFANEEAGYFRWTFSDHWSAGAGASHSQDRVKIRGGAKSTVVGSDDGPRDGDGGVADEDAPVRHHWIWSGRPTEHVALDWSASAGDWSLLNSNRLYLYFREGERDWAVYRNIATVTAPPVPRLPWTPRPYFTQFIYVTGRDGYGGLDRFSQFRWIAGVGVRPLESLLLSAYWQYRDIETDPGEWIQVRIAGLSASLLF